MVRFIGTYKYIWKCTICGACSKKINNHTHAKKNRRKHMINFHPEQRYVDPLIIVPEDEELISHNEINKGKTCKTIGCNHVARTRGYCLHCAQNNYNNGSLQKKVYEGVKI